MKVALSGATGRMGLAVARLAHAEGDIEIVGGSAAPSDPNQGRDIGELAGIGSLGVAVTEDLASALLGAEIVIDFSIAPVVKSVVQLAARNKIAVVSGTTNIDAEANAVFDKAAQTIPVLWAPNMSLGVQVLAELTELALRRLGPGFDAEIVEIHHRKKIDAPSGTAKRLADAVKAVRKGTIELHGRDGDVGKRTDEEVAVLGVRGGDVVGDHTVFLLGQGERIELVHRASNRDVFAHGALRAARFVSKARPGRYTIADVLG